MPRKRCCRHSRQTSRQSRQIRNVVARPHRRCETPEQSCMDRGTTSLLAYGQAFSFPAHRRENPENFMSGLSDFCRVRSFTRTSYLPEISKEGGRLMMRKEVVTSLCGTAVSAVVVIMVSTGSPG